MNRDTIARSIHEMMSGFKVSIGEAPYEPYETQNTDYVDFLKGAVDFVKIADEFYTGGCTPEDIHEYWLKWAQKNRPNHASLIPFDDMPISEKMKDDFVIHIIRTYIKYNPNI